MKKNRCTAPEPVTEEQEELLDRLAPAEPSRGHRHSDQGADDPDGGAHGLALLEAHDKESRITLEREHVGIKGSLRGLTRVCRSIPSQRRGRHVWSA